MKTTVIICEYNPFTSGHLKHIRSAREQTGCDTLICIMSGSFTQRGDSAILDKYQRAETAVRCGADMVVELPLIHAISPADNFAYGAIRILSQLPNVEYLSFGSECGDVSLLEKTAEFLLNEPKEFSDLIGAYLKEGYSFPKARSLALSKFSIENPDCADIANILEKPNNVLGISYIQSLKKLGINIKLHTITRDVEYNSTELDTDTPSASAVRLAMKNNRWKDLKDCVPSYTYNLLETYRPQTSSLGDLCLFKIKDLSGYDLENYYDVNGGLHNRMKIVASTSSSFEQFLEEVKTKNYTMARLKRISLYALFDITKDMYQRQINSPVYIHILAMRRDRKDILKALNTTCDNVLTKYSDRDKVDRSLRDFIKLDFKAQGVLSMINRSSCYNKTMSLI